MRKKTKRKERRAYITSTIVTSAYLMIWIAYLPRIKLQILIPYIILNTVMTVMICILFILLFGGLEEEIIVEKLHKEVFTEVFLKNAALRRYPYECIYIYNYYKEKGAKFYAKLYDEDEIFISVECNGKQEYTNYITRETFKRNFKFT